jgi:hypothetical protein
VQDEEAASQVRGPEAHLQVSLLRD